MQNLFSRRNYSLVKYGYLMIFLPLVFSLIACVSKPNENGDELAFIVAADWRYTATEKFHSEQYFLGALEAIQKVGKGAFILSPGDVEPPSASRALISQILGAEYPWYPVIGNHELDNPSYMEYLRNYNHGGKSLPNVVRAGPPGCEETTYSFDFGNCHFVVLNQYFDGELDNITDGDVVPELLKWLELDLAENTKKHIFVAGHEPLLAIPDMHNGRMRKQGTALDKYPQNVFKFYQTLMKYGVVAYFNGHTHNASISRLNGLWQIDVGHARGIENIYPGMVYQGIQGIFTNGIDIGMTKDQAIDKYFWDQPYEIKKVLDYMDLTDGVYYKELADEPALEALQQFYFEAERLGEKRDEFFQTYWKNWSISASTFTKINVRNNEITADVYRNDAKGGPYTLVYTEKLY